MLAPGLRLVDLEGGWDLRRRIADARAGLVGRFEGTSVWSRDGDGLAQVEEGLLHYGPAAPMRASRRYLWREDASGVHVLFEDGRAFHAVPDAGQVAVHDCPPDTYRVRYDFALPDRFTTIWHVTGPRKDAVLTSVFRRM